MINTCYRNDTLPSRQNAIGRLCVFPRTVAHWRGGFSTGATMKRTHGESCGHSQTKEYRAWLRMRQRCHSPKDQNWELYGGRGIKVCKRWMNSYPNFLQDMGRSPAGTSIERKDGNRGYSPKNCRWATNEEQQNNKSTNVRITHNGQTLTATQWERRLELPVGTISRRLYIGWSKIDTLTKPVMKKVRK